MSFITEKAICGSLDKYLFNRVWSDPYKEYRTNIRPRLLTADPVCGTYKARYDQIALPDSTTLFYVYAIAVEELSAFKLGAGSWTKISDYNRDNHLQLQLYTRDGVWLWRDSIYVRSGVVNNSVLIAVSRDMIKKCCGSSYNISRVYFTKYHDSDQVNDIKSTFYKISNSIDVAAAYKASLTSTITFLNGKPSSFANSRDIAIGDYIEVVNDGNVIATINIPINDNNGVTYLSNGQNKRTIVHVPKDKNPNMFRITYNTCDMYLIPSVINDDSNKARLRGTYVHLCDRANYLHQLTHSDFSIDNSLLSEIASSVAATKYSLKVLVRTHTSMNTWYQNGYMLTTDTTFVKGVQYYTKSNNVYTLANVTVGATIPNNTYYVYVNYLQGDVVQNPLYPGIVRDINYCELLYTHDDATILKFMLGEGPVNFNFWTADALEDSVYAQAMLQEHTVPPEANVQCSTCGLKNCCNRNITTYKCADYARRDIGYYVDVLGYYNTISLVCERTRHFRIGSNRSNLFSVPIPLCMYDCDSTSISVLCYHNGLKVADNTVRIFANSSSNYDTGNIITQDVLATNWGGTLYRKLAYDTDARCFFVELDANSIVLNEGDIVAFEVFEDKSTTSEIRTLPEYRDDTISEFRETFATDQFSVYKRSVGGTVRSANGDTQSGVNNYTLIDNPGSFDQNTKTLSVNKNFAGSTLLFYENSGITKVYENNDWEITEDDYQQIATGKLMWTSDVPVIGDSISYLVFLNGRTLIENIDYVVLSTSYGTSKIQSEIILQNLKWLQLHNTIEVYATHSHTRGYSNGYVSGKLITDVGESPFWFDSMSMLSVDGLIQSEFKSFFGCVFESSGTHRNGAPYVTRTLIPSSIIDIVDRYRTDNDYLRIIQLRDYFVGSNEDPVTRVVIPSSHSIFSIYLNAIVRDFLSTVQYRVTNETTLSPETIYYLNIDGTYVALSASEINRRAVVPVNMYYEKSNNYIFTDDEVFKLGKNYYVKNVIINYYRAGHTVLYPDGLDDSLQWDVNGVLVNERTMLESLAANIDSDDEVLRTQAEEAQQRLAAADRLSASYEYYVKDGDNYTLVPYNNSDVGIPMPVVYELTADTYFHDNKTYYTKSGSIYTEAVVTLGDPIGIYYTPTEDTVAAAGTVYYTRLWVTDEYVYSEARVEVGTTLSPTIVYYIKQNNFNMYYERSNAYFLKEVGSESYALASITPGEAVPSNMYYEDEYALTEDTRFVIGKLYYKQQNNTIYNKIEVVLNAVVPSNTYYEYIDGSFVLTNDTRVLSNKNYYTATTQMLYRACIPLSNIYYVKEPTSVKLLDFEMYANLERFKSQFAKYEWLKNIDAAYRLDQDLRYLDIFPMYHRTSTKSVMDYKKLKYLFKMLLPKDNIQHKDVINE